MILARLRHVHLVRWSPSRCHQISDGRSPAHITQLDCFVSASFRCVDCFSVFVVVFYFKFETAKIKHCSISVEFQFYFNCANTIRHELEGRRGEARMANRLYLTEITSTRLVRITYNGKLAGSLKSSYENGLQPQGDALKVERASIT